MWLYIYTYLLQVVQIKYDLPHSELQNIALQAMDMLNGNPSLDTHALVIYLLIVFCKQYFFIHQKKETTCYQQANMFLFKILTSKHYKIAN